MSGAAISRRFGLVALAVLALLTSGCITDSADFFVYFDNETDQTLYVRRRDLLDQLDKRAGTIAPAQTATLPLIGEGECRDLWVITTADGTLVKDPGRICWHDTVTIA